VTTVDVDAGKPASAPQDVPVTSSPAPAGSANAVAPARDTAAPAPASPQVAQPPVSDAPGAAANGAYALNLGVYGNRANADKLIASVRKQGFPAHGENTTYKGKPATRVVVGPFADRSLAETERLTLKSLHPDVPVALMASARDQTNDAPANAVPADRAGGWAVQLGAFGSEADANRMRDRLRELGFDGYVDSTPSGKGRLYRVRAGPVNQRDRAEELKAQIAAKMKISGIIVTQS
ncbi:MAG TPA: SPOR domain-containing protein, partial [Rhodanobacteraceae bacterium]|nr:SPOR domain-containing protein [Rhodanobacteraceae bacterium]